MADLSGLSSDDLRAIASGDMSKVSTAGLRALAGGAQGAQPAPQDVSGQPNAGGVGLPPTPTPAPVGTRLGTPSPVATEGTHYVTQDNPNEPPISFPDRTARFFKSALAGGIEQPLQRIRQLTRIAPPSDADIEETRQTAKGSPLGAALGNLATTAVPWAGANKLATTFTKTLNPGVAKYAAEAATTPAIAAGMEGTTHPVKSGESTAENMLIAAGAGKAAELGTRALFAPATGVLKPTADAQTLIDMGARKGLKDPGQGIVPSVYAGTEGPMSGIISAGQAVAQAIPSVQRRANQRVQQEIGDVAGLRAHPVTPATREAVEKGPYSKNMFDDANDAYTALYSGKTFTLPPRAGHDYSQAGVDVMKEIPDAMKSTFKGAVKEIVPPSGAPNLSPAQFKDKMDAVQERINSWGGKEGHTNEQMTKAWEAVKAKMVEARNRSLTPAEIAEVERLGTVFHHATILEKAIGMPGSDIGSSLIKTVNQEGTTPLQIRNALKGHYQDITEPASRILENQARLDPVTKKAMYGGLATLGLGGATLVNPLLGLAAIPILGAGYAGTTRGGAKALMGQYEWQKKAADIMRTWGRPIAGDVGAYQGVDK